MRKILLLVLMLVSVNISNAFYNRGEIRNESRREMNDDTTDTSRQKWTDAILNARIDMAQEDVVMRTRCVVSRSTIATTCGTYEYQLPDSCLVPSRVTYDTDGSSVTIKYTELSYTTIDTLDRDAPGWEYNSSISSGTPVYYYYRGNLIGLYPSPDFRHSGVYGDIRISYIVRPSTFTSDTDVPFEGYRHLYPYHQILVWYVCALCSKDEGDSNMMTFYWNKYISDLALMQERLNNKLDRLGGFKR